MQIYNIPPTPKPRMTISDRRPYPPKKYKGKVWPRPAVTRWKTFKNMVIAHKVTLPEDGAHVIFHIAMPPSWPKKKKERMLGQLHKQTPDWDNLAKALCDAIYGDDSCISDIRITKRWGYEGAIQVYDRMCFV